MNTSDLINFYCQLLAIQFRNLPLASSTVAAYATEIVADQIFVQTQNAYNLFAANGYQAAVGVQLDTLAGYVGAPRTIYNYDPSIPYFALYSYVTTPPSNVGFASYTDVTDPVDSWLSYSTSETSYVLTDGQLQLLIAYLIAVHASPHTLSSIDNILQTFFGSYCILIDNEDMSVVYQHSVSDPNFLFGIIAELGFLPAPAGVSVSVTEV